MNQVLAITAGVALGIIIAVILSTQIGIHQEDLDAYSRCIKEQYGMSPTEVYQKTGEEPVCN